MNYNYQCPRDETWTEQTLIEMAKRLYKALQAVEDQSMPDAPRQTGYTEAELMRLMERLATGR